MTDKPREKLIPSRVMLIGEGRIPSEVMEALEDRLLRIFMREPDPDDWPPEMGHLVQYLPAEERIKHSILRILRGHDLLLGESLETWATTVRNELMVSEIVGAADRDMIVEEMAQHLKRLLRGYLRDD